MTDSTRDIHPITDSHCHLDFPDFDGELPDVIARAQAAGVTRMVTICTKLKNEPAVRAIAEAHAPVFYAAGTHPMSVATEPMASFDDLMALTKHPKMVGIGETGLDYHYTADSAEAQQTSLRTHIAASRDSGLPLIIQHHVFNDGTAANRVPDDGFIFLRKIHCFCVAPTFDIEDNTIAPAVFIVSNKPSLWISR